MSDSKDSTTKTTNSEKMEPIFSSMIDDFLIRALSACYTIGVVAFVILGWQALIQEDAVVVPFILGAVVVFGTFLALWYVRVGELIESKFIK